MRGLTSELLMPKKKMADCMSSPNFNIESEKKKPLKLFKPKRFFFFSRNKCQVVIVATFNYKMTQLEKKKKKRN
jgi:hypothetical protein